ncbi:hypothetical protein EJB05_22027, partial [Eragrostis curvula]
LTGDEPPPLEAFPTLGLYQSLVQSGWGTRVVPYKKDSSVAQGDYSELFDANGYCKSPGVGKAIINVSDNPRSHTSFGGADVHVTNDKSAARDTSEEEQPPTDPFQFEDLVEIQWGDKQIIYCRDLIDGDEEGSDDHGGADQMGEDDESEKNGSKDVGII